MNCKTVAPLLTALALLAGPAHALDLLNQDDQNYTIDVIVGQDTTDVESFAVEAGGTMTGICLNGCVLELSNGLSQTFTGVEEVLITDGDFVVSE